MESATRSSLFRALVVLGLCLLGTVFAQERTRGRVRFGKIEPFNLSTPEFKETTHAKAKREHEWLQLFVEYEASGGSDGWLDGLELKWYVLAKVPAGHYVLMETSATYVDVETRAKIHYAAVYIRPSFALRYFDKDRVPKGDIWVRVEAVLGGRVVDAATYSREKSPGDNWWTAKPPRVRLLPDTLLTRDQTPFAPLDYDFYEHMRPSTGIR